MLDFKHGIRVTQLRFIKKISLNDFWLIVSTELPTMSEVALNILLLFCATYLCKVAFSALIVLK